MLLEILSCVLYAFFLSVIAYHFIDKIQKNNYETQLRLQIVGALWDRYALTCLLFAAACCVISAFAEHITTGWLNLILLTCATLLSLTCRYKVKLVFTKRLIRQYALTVCLLLCLLFLLPCWVALGCLPLVCVAAFYILLPFEQRNNDRYVAYAKAKLDKIKGVKIAITGSYGKTSVKNILCSILQTKYLVGCSPRNFNTPLGIARWVSSDDFDGKDVYIFEMGARRKGDITKLMDLIQPQIGLLTGINSQHLATFKSLSQIIDEKLQIVKKMSPQGKVFVNCDDRICAELPFDERIERVGVGRKYYHSDEKLTQNGCSFSFHNGDKVVYLASKLLGMHNVSNITLCCAVAVDCFGIGQTSLRKGVDAVEQLEHRLNSTVTQYNNFKVTILDDAYNGNIDGIRASSRLLKLYAGTKIVIAQGIVEGGGMQADLNIRTGNIIGEVADKAVVLGVNAKQIAEGLVQGGMEAKDIAFATDIASAVSLANSFVNKDDSVILFQNDIP